MNDEERLFDALKAKRNPAFWKAQKARILGRLKPRAFVPRWAWAPALAGLLGALVVWQRQVPAPAAVAAPPQSEWALLEQLDLLEDLETLEKLEDSDA